MKEHNCKTCIEEKKQIILTDITGRRERATYCGAIRQFIDRPEEQFCFVYKEQGLRARLRRWIERKIK